MPSPNPVLALDALKALARAGASDALLAQAVRELAAESLPPAPVQDPVPSRLREPYGEDAPVPEALDATLPPSPARPEVVVVRDGTGRRTSVSMPRPEWQALVRRHGDEAEARRIVREYARQAPGEGNRSRWVLERLRAEAG